MRRVVALSLVLGLSALAWGEEPPAAPPAPDVAPEVRAFLTAWAASMKDVQTLRVSFTQTKRLRILRRPLVSEGTTLLKGRRVLMVVDGRDGRRETELLVEADRIRLHYPRQNRVEVYPVRKEAPSPPFVLFGGDIEGLPRTHHVALTRQGDDDVLVLRPRDAGSTERETRLVLRGYVVQRLTQVNAKGDEVELAVTAFLKNAPVDDAELALHPAADAKVVEVFPAPDAEPEPSPGR